MNREIKFRAWNGSEMIYLPLAGLQYYDFEGSYALSFVVDGYKEFWAHENYKLLTEKASNFPIMQFTGFRCKDNTEIYEGDICSGHSDGNGVIEWSEFDGGYHYRFDDDNVVGIYEVLKDILVEGNIYENPNFLK